MHGICDTEIDQLLHNDEEGIVTLRTRDNVRFTALKMNTSEVLDILRAVFPDYFNISYKISEQCFDALLPNDQSVKYSLHSLLNEEGFFALHSADVFNQQPDQDTVIRLKLFEYSRRLLMFGKLANMTPEQLKEAQKNEREVQRVIEATKLQEFRAKMIKMIAAKEITVEEATKQTDRLKSTLTALYAPTRVPVADRDFNKVPIVTPTITERQSRDNRKDYTEMAKGNKLSNMTPISSLRGQFS